MPKHLLDLLHGKQNILIVIQINPLKLLFIGHKIGNLLHCPQHALYIGEIVLLAFFSQARIYAGKQAFHLVQVA